MPRAAKLSLVAALAVALAVAAAHARERAAAAFAQVVADEDRFYLPPPSWLRAFSVGYNEAAADLVWVATVVYFGERAQFAKRRSAVNDMPQDAAAAQFTMNYLTVVTGLDPRFRAAYSDGAKLTLYHRGRITRRTVEMAIELLEQGVAQFPSDGELAFSLGFLCYYELEPFLKRGSPEWKASREKGVRWVQAAATMPGAPPYVSVMSSSLLRREGMDDVVIEHLRALLLKETDPGIRRTLEAQLRLEIGKAAERDIDLARRLERRWRAELPWVPFDLFLLLEPGVPLGAAERRAPWAADGEAGGADAGAGSDGAGGAP